MAAYACSSGCGVSSTSAVHPGSSSDSRIAASRAACVSGDRDRSASSRSNFRVGERVLLRLVALLDDAEAVVLATTRTDRLCGERVAGRVRPLISRPLRVGLQPTKSGQTGSGRSRSQSRVTRHPSSIDATWAGVYESVCHAKIPVLLVRLNLRASWPAISQHTTIRPPLARTEPRRSPSTSPAAGHLLSSGSQVQILPGTPNLSFRACNEQTTEDRHAFVATRQSSLPRDAAFRRPDCLARALIWELRAALGAAQDRALPMGRRSPAPYRLMHRATEVASARRSGTRTRPPRIVMEDWRGRFRGLLPTMWIRSVRFDAVLCFMRSRFRVVDTNSTPETAGAASAETRPS
jgi:hypothetical protein